MSIKKCLHRDEVYEILDNLWKPKRFVKYQFRNRKVIRFVDRLHNDRISLNRIVKIDCDFEYPTLYAIQIWYLTRRGNERYMGYAVSR